MESRKEEHIVVVTHGKFLKAIIGSMMLGDRLNPDTYNLMDGFLWTHNTGVTVVDYKYPELVPKELRKNKRWRLMTWNDYSHLGEIQR